MKNNKEIDNKWSIKDNKLSRSFEFENFITTFNFMKDIAIISEEINHHPTWTNTYNKLEIILFTHDKGEITELDFRLAQIIDNKLIGFQ